MYCFFIGTWLSPEVSGATPPPSAHFTFTDIGNSRAVMFGGFQPGHKDWKSSDLYLFNLGRKVGLPCSVIQ